MQLSEKKQPIFGKKNFKNLAENISIGQMLPKIHCGIKST